MRRGPKPGSTFLPRPRDPVERFLSKVTYEPNSGCWLWVGGWQRAGYGHMHYNGEIVAHRVSAHLFKGGIPSGLHVLHRCDVRECVNPDHLFFGTHSDNMKDCARKGRAIKPSIRKTHCVRGHDLSLHKNAYGSCRKCATVRAVAARAANPDRFRANERRRYWANKETGT